MRVPLTPNRTAMEFDMRRIFTGAATPAKVALTTCELLLKTATALLITFAAALVLVHAEVYFSAPLYTDGCTDWSEPNCYPY